MKADQKKLLWLVAIATTVSVVVTYASNHDVPILGNSVRRHIG